jgi:hypothetical protein
MLDSPEGVCPGQARFEYPATSVLFSNPDGTDLRSLPWFYGAGDPLDWVQPR